MGLFCAVMLVLCPWQIDLDVPYPFYKGPLLVPMLALSLGVLSSLPAWARLLKPSPGALWKVDGQGISPKPFVMLLIGALYPFMIMLIGLEAATFTALSAELIYLGHRTILLAIGLPVFVSLLFWLIFKLLLDVFFPTPEIIYLLSA